MRRRELWLAPLLALLVFAAVLEALMYCYVLVQHGLLPHQLARRDFYPYEHHYQEDHPYLPYLALPGKYGFLEFNSFGDRGPELDAPKRRTRILCYGGSTTFDAAHPWEQTWPGQLQALLGKDRYEVVIAAQNGATTADTLVNYGLIHSHHQADYVLAYEGNNDLESSFCADIKPDYSHRRRKIALNISPFVRLLPRWLDWSGTYVAFRSVATAPLGNLHSLYTRPCEKPDLEGGPFGLDLFRRNLLNIHALARANGAQLVLGTFVFHRPWAEKNMTKGFGAAWERGSRLENDIIRELPKGRQGLAVAEIARGFPASEETMLDFCHLTEKGNAVIAREFHAVIRRLEAAKAAKS
jgi:hypothetical protein